MITRKTSLVIGGILSILLGSISSVLLFIYTALINQDLAFLFIFSSGAIGLGISLLIKAAKQKSAG
jgi:hypothetical protein